MWPRVIPAVTPVRQRSRGELAHRKDNRFARAGFPPHLLVTTPPAGTILERLCHRVDDHGLCPAIDNNVVGLVRKNLPQGSRWLPMHGVPHGQGELGPVSNLDLATFALRRDRGSRRSYLRCASGQTHTEKKNKEAMGRAKPCHSYQPCWRRVSEPLAARLGGAA